MIIKGNLVDIHLKRIYPADIVIKGRYIESISEIDGPVQGYIMPGLIDSHIHIESSMVTPGSFAVSAVSRGTIGVVSDPHEIANVMGIAGVRYMIEDGKKVPLKFWFGAPSCVPATDFETSGAKLGIEEIEELLAVKDIKYLSEMMNYPGVIYDNQEVAGKLKIAQKYNKPVDGHAPGLSGELLIKYVKAGISTDHECSTIAEAEEKIRLGMKILIREGSAARNLEALKGLINIAPDKVMLCSDDLHPEMLEKRHLDKIIAGLFNEGFNLFDIISAASLNPSLHYGLPAGLLRKGDPADFIIVDEPAAMNVIETWIDGCKVYENGRVLFSYKQSDHLNNFNSSFIDPDDLKVLATGNKMKLIESFDGELLTKRSIVNVETGKILNADPERDILKIVVKDRYNDAGPALAFIRGFGLKQGAIASSVAHDCHNIISVGTNDEDIAAAVNEIVRMKGGLAVSVNGSVKSLPLPVAGIMSDKPVHEIAEKYENLSRLALENGCSLKAPFMTLSFMALLVIPELKLSDKGLFDGTSFGFVPLFG
jgi:adenine deaminase